MTQVVVVDLDGTLIPGNSFRLWMRFLAIHAARHRRFTLLAHLLVAGALRATRVISHRELKRRVLLLSAWVSAGDVDRFASKLCNTLRPELVGQIRAHLAEDATIALVSAAPDFYLEQLARAAGIETVIGTPSTITDSWEETAGEAKWSRLQERFGRDVQIDIVYMDHHDDLPLAIRARRTVLVQPSPQTRRILYNKVQGASRLQTESATRELERRQVAALMVTYNSAAVAERAVRALVEGSMPPEVIVIVDNGSEDTAYLDKICSQFPLVRTIRLAENVGFCAGNNLGLRLVGDRHLLLVNPDAFVSRDFLRDAVNRLHEDFTIGAVQPKLLGADGTSGMPTGLIDSVGIDEKPWGQLFDRGMGEVDMGQYDQEVTEPSALCAAVMLLRHEAVASATLDKPLFDERFFMYKEDIDLSWRLRRRGWRIVMDPCLQSLHCRGWHQDRRAMPVQARRLSLINEWRLWIAGWSPDQRRLTVLPYLLAKSCYVLAGR